MTYTTLGSLIREAREKRGWEQADLASQMGRGQQAISRWEKGGSRPKLVDLHLLISIFSADSTEWLSQAGYQPLEPDASLIPYLPFQNLSDENFELFCRDFVQALNPESEVQRYGVSGDAQLGIDIYAKHADGNLVDYQSKRHTQFGPKDVSDAIDATTFDASHHTLLLSRRATASARNVVLNRDDWSLFDIEDISAKIRALPRDKALRIVDTYFPGLRKRFLGIDNPSPWLTPDVFFAPLETKLKLFSHGWNFVGRNKEMEQLKEFENQNNAKAILLSGRGGIGKSRLLMAWSNSLSSSTSVSFLSQGVEVSPQDFESLPNRDAYLVVDDAHDRGDIVALLYGIARTKPEIKIILSTRPYGLTLLKDQLLQTGFTFESDKIINIDNLSENDAALLSEEILTEMSGNKIYARQIARITRDCPLATVIGSQLVGKGQIYPETLNNHKEFESELMMRFREVVTGKIGGVNAEAVQELLNLVSLVQPVNPSHPVFQKMAEQILARNFDKILRDLDALEDAGVLIRRAGNVRIAPDLLADYIREEASYSDKNGISTHYADKVFSHAQNELATNVLVNISQLDWRLANDGAQVKLLDEVWSNLKEQFRGSKILTRSAILSALEKIAYYQPEQALDFIQLALDEPTDELETEDPQLAFGKPDYTSVINKIPAILRYIAFHGDYLTDSLELLKKLAESDKRPTNSYPDHPLRVLQDLASIEPGKPREYSHAVAERALQWLDQDSKGKFSPLDVLDQLLETEGHTTETRGAKMTMTAFKVKPEAVAEIRQQILDKAFDVVRDRPLRDGVRALKTIEHGLRHPMGLFGGSPSDTELDAWEPGIVKVLESLRELVQNPNIDPAIATEIRSAVSWHARNGRPAAKSAATSVLAAIPTDLPHEISRALIDSWGWTFDRYDDEGNRSEILLSNWRSALAKKVIQENKDRLPELTSMLEERVVSLRDSFESRHPDAGAFLRALIEESEEFGSHLAGHLLEHTESPLADWFGVIVIVMAKKNKTVPVVLMQRALEKNVSVFNRGVARTIGWGLYNFPIHAEEIDMLRELAQSKDTWVRQSIVRAMKRFEPEMKSIALEILLTVDFSDSKEVADEVLGQFEKTHGNFRISETSANQIATLFDGLVKCEDIDNYHISLFLSELSLIDPASVVEFFMRRVEHQESLPKMGDYRALPRQWSKTEPLHFSKTQKYEQLLRKIRDWATAKPSEWIRFHFGSDLFKLVSTNFDDITLAVLDEWIMSGEQTKLEGAVALLSEANSSFIWNNHQFVTRLIEQAQKHGNTCYMRVTSSLYSIFIQGGRNGTPGQPFPEDIERRDRSLEVLQTLPTGSAAHKFYKSLHQSAIAEIKMHTDDDFEVE